jgi:ATP-dependent DNA ligase
VLSVQTSPPTQPGHKKARSHCYRIIARKDGSRVTLWSRYGTNFTDRLPRVAEAICSLAAENAVIDGEAVASRPDGQSDFAALRTKAGGARACLVCI